MKQAFVVGGEASFVQSHLTKSLAKHNIAVRYHWSWDKTKAPQSLPRGIDLVYFCTDMIAHKLSIPVLEMCREQGVPYVNGTRKWAESIERLNAAGFPVVPAAPLEVPMSAETQPKASLGLNNPIQRVVVEALARKPFAPSAEVWEYARELNPKIMGNITESPERLSWGRKQLGLSIARGGGMRTIRTDVTTFMRVVSNLGLKGVVPPPARHTVKETRPVAVPPPEAAPVAEVVALPTPAPAAQETVVSAAPAIKPAPAAPINPMDELKDLLLLVRVKMAEMSIVDLHLTPESVKYKQMVITEGDLAI